MKKLLLALGLALLLAGPAWAGWSLGPPAFIQLYTPIAVSVKPGRWDVTTSNIKIQVVWFRDPAGKWHSHPMARFGPSVFGRVDTSFANLDFFSIPGVWTGEVVVQTSPIGIDPPANLFEMIAGPTAFLVGGPSPTPTPTPSPTATPTPTASPTPTPTVPTPTPSPTPRDKLFK